MRRPFVLGIVLAGGEGKRLAPLTADRAKPAVPFAGNYRLIDFVLSNLVNAGYLRIVVLTQYKSHSLDRHIALTWRLSPLLGNYVTPVPAQMRRGPHWFSGSADAIYQNLNLLYDEQPDYVCVFSADHIYRMDARQMVAQHIDSGADVTVAGLRIPKSEAFRFGILETEGSRVVGFHEKPREVSGLVDHDGTVLASMGNYVFTAKALIDAVSVDAASHSSHHDLGGDVMPMLVKKGSVAVYDFAENVVAGQERERGYWRDVGSLDTYYDAHMDLVSVEPGFNLYNREWPILTWHEPLPPAKFVFAEPERTGHALDSMICAGVVVSGGTVRRSILSPGVTVRSRADVEGSVLMHGVTVGRGAVVRHAIIDKQVVIPEGARIGVDADDDRRRGFTISQQGVTVVGKAHKIES